MSHLAGAAGVGAGASSSSPSSKKAKRSAHSSPSNTEGAAAHHTEVISLDEEDGEVSVEVAVAASEESSSPVAHDDHPSEAQQPKGALPDESVRVRAENESQPASAASSTSYDASAAAAPSVDSSSIQAPSRPLPSPSPAVSSRRVSLVPSFTSSTFHYADRASINEFLVCKLCNNPLYRPLEHDEPECGFAFCRSCLEQRQRPGEAAKDDSCPVCHRAFLVGKNTREPSRIVMLQLDALPINCVDCGAGGAGKDGAVARTLTRGQFEEHYINVCMQSCPFAALGCPVRLPRSQLHAHSEACSFAPVGCEAANFGCSWSGQRDARPTHAESCSYIKCLPAFQALVSKHARKGDEVARLRIALQTTEAQLLSYKERYERGGWWTVGTVLDALDTENAWMPAKILKVDPVKKLYKITYLDWDSSWDESLPFNSPRLAPARTYTGLADVEKHVEKQMTGTLCGTVGASNGSSAGGLSASGSMTNAQNASSAAARAKRKSTR